MLPIYSIHSLGDYNEKGSPVLSTKICMSNKTHRASPFSDNHELLLPKYRNKDSKMRRNVVASLESLAILCTQILDQNLGSLASSLHHSGMLGTTYCTRRNDKFNKNEKKIRLYYSCSLTPPLTSTMFSQEGSIGMTKGEGGCPAFWSPCIN